MPSPYSDETWEHEIKDVCRQIVERVTPLSVYAFGSSTGESRHAGSDLDICVVLPDGFCLKQARKKLFISPLTALPLDLLLYEESDFLKRADTGGICQVILEDGRLLYGKRLKLP